MNRRGFLGSILAIPLVSVFWLRIKRKPIIHDNGGFYEVRW